MRSGVRQSKFAKKICTGKYIGGYKPSAYHQAGPTSNRPFLNLMPSAKNPRGTSKKTSQAEESSKKRKRSVSDSKSPLIEKKKYKKASKPKARGTLTDPVTINDPAAQPVDHQTQGETPTVESTTSRPVDPEPTASQNDPIFAGLENLSESAAHIESLVSSPVRVPIPEQDPTHYRVPSPSRDPTPNRVPTPVRDSSPIQDPIPVEDPIPIENPIPTVSEEASHDIPREEQVPLPEQSEAERQQDPEPSPVPLSSKPEQIHVAASSSIRRPDSPCTEARKEQLNALGRQSLFIQDAVEALYQVGKEMDWLNITASEEMESVKVELSRIAEAFNTLPQDLKEAFAKFQHLEEQSLLEEQSNLRTVESKTIAVLEYTDSQISDHDAKIHEMAKVITSLDDKLAKFEEQQENILNVLRSIDHTVSELNARKGEGQSDSSREPAQRSSDQELQVRRSDHDSSRRSSSRPEHKHRS
ncbi:hypothetical protein OROHE_009115 [Orobanche hederae]